MSDVDLQDFLDPDDYEKYLNALDDEGKKREINLRLAVISDQLKELNEERDKLLEKQLKDVIAEFRSLNWLKGMPLGFSTGEGPYGDSEFLLTGFFPEHLEEITNINPLPHLLGRGDDYRNLINIRYDGVFDAIGKHFTIFTGNGELFLRFIDYVKPKITLTQDHRERAKVYDGLVGRLEDELGWRTNLPSALKSLNADDDTTDAGYEV